MALTVVSGSSALAALAMAFLLLAHTTTALTGIRAAYGDTHGLKTWAESQEQCRAWGGHLLKAQGDDVMQRLAKVMCTDVLWVGTSINAEEWKWLSDGTIVSNDVWHEAEPSDYRLVGGECGLGFKGMHTGKDVQLLDAHCDSTFPFVCEIQGLKEDEVVWLKDDGAMKQTECSRIHPDVHEDRGSYLGSLSPQLRSSDVIMSVESSIPSQPGCLFESGGPVVGTFIGIVATDAGLSFRLTAGGRSVGDVSDDDSAAVMIPLPDARFPQDDHTHELVWKISTSDRAIVLAIDGVHIASAYASNSFPEEGWSGSDEACVGEGCGDIAAGGAPDEWQGKFSTGLSIWKSSENISAYYGAAEIPNAFETCFSNVCAKEYEMPTPQAYVNVFLLCAFVSAFPAYFVSWYCCRHDMRIGKCCPMRRAPSLATAYPDNVRPRCFTGGAFCTLPEAPTMISEPAHTALVAGTEMERQHAAATTIQRAARSKIIHRAVYDKVLHTRASARAHRQAIFYKAEDSW